MDSIDGFLPPAHGDVLIAATELNDPKDDHAGRGRIFQYGADLVRKSTWFVPHTTHLVQGLRFDREGRLWAFDSQARLVLMIHRDGRVERRDFGGRAFSNVNFAGDGSILLGEHLAGSTIRPETQARMKTTLSKLPGTDRYGDGHVFRFAADGKLLKEYATQTHGGMAGFLGVTMATLAADERTLVYVSETGQRLMRYDLANDRQLPDILSFAPPYPPGPPPMFFDVDYARDGTLYVLRGGAIHAIDAAGRTLREIPLEGPAWALLELTGDGAHAFAVNFFTGVVAKVELASGRVVGRIDTGAPKAVAGVAEYQAG